MRDWARTQRIAELQALAASPEPDAGEEPVDPGTERFLTIVVGADRTVREEWDSGLVRSVPLDDATNWVLLDPSWIADKPGVTVVGESCVAGRQGIAIEAVGEHGPAAMLLPGSDRCVAVLDAAFDVVLRCEAWRGPDLLMVEELTEVTFG